MLQTTDASIKPFNEDSPKELIEIISNLRLLANQIYYLNRPIHETQEKGEREKSGTTYCKFVRNMSNSLNVIQKRT